MLQSVSIPTNIVQFDELEISGIGFQALSTRWVKGTTFSKRLFSDGRISAEALVDSQTGVPGQAGDGGVILMVVHHTVCQKSVKLWDTPGAVYPTKPPALQLHRQIIVGGQAVSCPLHLVVKETDARQVGLNGGRRSTPAPAYGRRRRSGACH